MAVSMEQIEIKFEAKLAAAVKVLELKYEAKLEAAIKVIDRKFTTFSEKHNMHVAKSAEMFKDLIDRHNSQTRKTGEIFEQIQNHMEQRAVDHNLRLQRHSVEHNLRIYETEVKIKETQEVLSKVDGNLDKLEAVMIEVFKNELGVQILYGSQSDNGEVITTSFDGAVIDLEQVINGNEHVHLVGFGGKGKGKSKGKMI